MSNQTRVDAALKNLLARIHGDNGHYTEQHGMLKSIADAEQKIVDAQKQRTQFVHNLK